MLYLGITRAWFTAIQAVAAAKIRIAIAGDEGTATGSTPVGNVTVSWIYDPQDQTLTAGCVKKPLLPPESKIETELTALVESARPGGS